MFSDTLAFFTLLEQDHEYNLCFIFIEDKAERKITDNLHLPYHRSCINKLEHYARCFIYIITPHNYPMTWLVLSLFYR